MQRKRAILKRRYNKLPNEGIKNSLRVNIGHDNHTGDIILNIVTDKENETNIRTKIKSMEGVKEVINVNIGKANVNAFTNWSKDDALRKLKEIRRLEGVEDARAKILLNA